MTYTDGYNKAMALSTRNGFCDGTYMYDSSRRVNELAKKDPDYETANADYHSGFAACVYSLHRC